jgi:hypothetical protein
MKEIKREPTLPTPTNCFGHEEQMATWYECPHCKKASPMTREWVSLTDEEIKKIIGPWGETPIKGYTRKLFDQIEAKLKEKNNG